MRRGCSRGGPSSNGLAAGVDLAHYVESARRLVRRLPRLLVDTHSPFGCRVRVRTQMMIMVALTALASSAALLELRPFRSLQMGTLVLRLLGYLIVTDSDVMTPVSG
jgi:hypothetical protein